MTARQLSREEHRALQRIKQKEAQDLQEAKRKEREQKKGENNTPTAYQLYVRDEVASIRTENPAMPHEKARKLASERWKTSPLNPNRLAQGTMGIIIGSVHQLYACNDEETPAMIAEKLGVELSKLMKMNANVYPGLGQDVQLMEGTILKLPNR
jgi:hypothetical protein